MGKVLVIKGADFSENAVDTLTPIQWSNMVLEDGGLNLLGFGDPAFGTEIEVSNHYRIRADLNVYIDAGETIHFKGLKGITGNEIALRIDACMYSQDERTRASVVHSLSHGNINNIFPVNIDGGDMVTVTNEYDAGYYFAFVFAGQTKGESLNVANYSPIQYYID